jgi:hypothetical protein
MTTPVKVLLWLGCAAWAINALCVLHETIAMRRFDIGVLLVFAGCAVLALLYGCAAAGWV